MGLFARKKTEEKKEKAVQTDEAQGKASMKDLYSAKSGDATKGETQKKDRKFGDAYRVLIKPLITEKAGVLGSENKYVFMVAKSVNKIEVAKAVEEVYGVKPEGVNIIRMRGRDVRYGRVRGRRKDWKKAIVALPAGASIKVYEGV